MDPLILYLIVLFLTTWLGGGIAFIFRSPEMKRSRLFLSFSGAFLFGLTLTRFLPRLFQEAPTGMGAWILFGFFLQLILDFISRGIEHGHVQKDAIPRNSIPYGVLIGLSFHAFLESLPLGHSELLDGDHLLIGLAFHKLPVSLALAGLLSNGLRRGPAILAFGCFSLMAPLGILLGHALPSLLEEVPSHLDHYLLALVMGVLLHVSTTILFESSEGHRLEAFKMLAVLLGFGLALLIG